ncbi:MAG: ATP-binding protein [Bacteroidales bacterium]|nr:ATP-binding protein [Bacteroidales bacterium]
MDIDIRKLIGEATSYDKKEMVEVRRPKSWLKSVSAFANGEGGVLVFGITDDDVVVGLAHAEEDGETISENVKTKLDPVPNINLEYKEVDGAKLILLHVQSSDETPCYYIGDKQRIAYIRIGNESVVADRTQLRSLVIKGSGRSFDTLPSPYRFEDMAFSRLRSIHFKRLNRSFEDSEFISWGIIGEDGRLTNAGALVADDSPVRHARIFCTRWNGLTMTSGLGEAIDDVELEGCVIGQLQDAVTFVRNNSHKKWWKEADHREELPDYPERAVTESIANAIIHRSYMEIGSEVHIDMYDDRIEIYSPGGMMDGRLIQQLDPLTVPSKRRNPLLADIFSRLDLMERRGSGMKKIIDAYKRYERFPNYRTPEFSSNSSEFHVTLWNLNYEQFLKDVTKEQKDVTKGQKYVTKELKNVTKEQKDVTKELKERKDFLKAQRKIYRYISEKPTITTIEMAERMGVSKRQLLRYIKILTDMNLIVREGGRKTGIWRIIDKDYDSFFVPE